MGIARLRHRKFVDEPGEIINEGVYVNLFGFEPQTRGTSSKDSAFHCGMWYRNLLPLYLTVELWLEICTVYIESVQISILLSPTLKAVAEE